MNEDFAEELKKLMEEERKALLEQLARGQIKDYPDYRYVCGNINAVEMLLVFIDKLVKRQEKDNE